jgi:hypothetical protein
MAKPAPITIPTEPIGSIPRRADLIDRVAKGDAGFVGLSASIDPHIETPEEARVQALEPGENYRWCYADGLFLIEVAARLFCVTTDGVAWLS